MNLADASISDLRDGAAAELKQSQFSLLQLRVGALDLDSIQTLVAAQVAAAPRLLTGAAVALDLAAVQSTLDSNALDELLIRLRFCGLKPVAVICASDSAMAELAEASGLPAIASYRRGKNGAVAESSSGEMPIPPRAVRAADSAPAPAPAPAPIVAAAPAAVAVPALHVHQPVRSGQQLYARGSDLVLTTTVSAGAEVIADGCIHVYGRLSGKALAGALGDTSAKIYCLSFDAELVSIAGRFRVFESVPAELKGKACHLFLSGDRLEIQPLQ
jgi:septum site-determining protein MinC